MSPSPTPPERSHAPRQTEQSGATAADLAAAHGENQRQVQLLLALADDPGWVSEPWIFNNVPGYGHVDEGSRDRYLREDTAALLAAGVPVEVAKPTDKTSAPKRLRINRTRWNQVNPGFNDTEASVVFQAANAAFGSEELASAAVAGWRKLAASMHRAFIAKPNESVVIADPADLSGGDFGRLLTAMTAPRQTVELWYSRQYGQDDEMRTLEPWALINLRGRFYVLGHDVDRQAPRMFRLSRVRDVNVVDDTVTRPIPSEDLQQFAEKILHRGEQTYEAIVRIDFGSCADVIANATPLGQGRYQLPPATLHEIVSVGLSYAPDLIVEAPEQARSEIIARLRQVLARHGDVTARPEPTAPEESN